MIFIYALRVRMTCRERVDDWRYDWDKWILLVIYMRELMKLTNLCPSIFSHKPYRRLKHVKPYQKYLSAVKSI